MPHILEKYLHLFCAQKSLNKVVSKTNSWGDTINRLKKKMFRFKSVDYCNCGNTVSNNNNFIIKK